MLGIRKCYKWKNFFEVKGSGYLNREYKLYIINVCMNDNYMYILCHFVFSDDSNIYKKKNLTSVFTILPDCAFSEKEKKIEGEVIL